MSSALVVAMVTVGGGLALAVGGWLARVGRRTERLSEILDLPYGEWDVPVEDVTETRSAIVESSIGLASRVVNQFDTKGSLRRSLERARIPMRPGELVVVTACGAVTGGALLLGITQSPILAAMGVLLAPLAASSVIRGRIARRRRAFEDQLPDALGLIASSLSAGHTFLRAIQMMCEESEPPLAEEFRRVVSETQLGDPLVDALDRMAARLEIRDMDWVVQAIRIQQTVGGKLADLLHTLADFIRAREEVRREVKVLTAEGRISAWILTALAPLLLVAVQVLSPEYMKPMFQGWGLVVLAGTALMVLGGSAIIFRMTKIEV